MAFIFQIKRVGSDPTSGALASGELGYNTSTKQLFVGNGPTSASAVSMVGHTHSGYEPAVSAGTTAQYYRGDKSWQTFPTIPTTASQVGALSTSGGTVSGVTKIQSGDAASAFILGGNVASSGLTARVRKLGRMGFPVFENNGSTNTLNCAALSLDSNGTTNYVEFGGRTGDITNTAPDQLKFVVATTHNSTTLKKELIVGTPTSVTINANLKANSISTATGDTLHLAALPGYPELVLGDGTITFDGANVITSANIASFTPVVPTPIGVSITGSVTLNAPWFTNTFFSVTAASTITIPTDATYNHPVGTETHFYRATSSDVTFSPASGVTLTSEGTKRKINAQYQAATLKKIAANSWVLIGALKA